MPLERIVLFVIFGLPVIITTVLVIAAHMRSSQLTREEEKRSGRLL